MPSHRRTPALFSSLATFLTFQASTALASAGALDSLVSTVENFNDQLRVLGIALTITGLIASVVINIIGLGGMSRSITALIGGIIITSAADIVHALLKP